MTDVGTLRLSSLPPGQTQTAPGHVTILLATYNGARTLPDQLQSLLFQTHADWSLIVSDDGSTDGTQGIIRAFQASNPDRRIVFLRGPGKGSAQNFLSLLRAAGASPWVAFADQDDWWFPDKLARSLSCTKSVVGPALYGSRTVISGADLTPIRKSLRFKRRPSFANALVQNVAGGNTMLLNHAALDILQPASLAATDIVAHDWWCYQMVTGCGGQVVLDDRPTLLYRQHGANQIGANDSLRAGYARLRGLLQGNLASWIERHGKALDASRRWLTPEACRQLDLTRQLGVLPLHGRLKSLIRAGLYRQRRRGSAALWLAAVCGKL